MPERPAGNVKSVRTDVARRISEVPAQAEGVGTCRSAPVPALPPRGGCLQQWERSRQPRCLGLGNKQVDGDGSPAPHPVILRRAKRHLSLSSEGPIHFTNMS